MNLSKRGEYALRTLIRLGVAQRMGREVVSVSVLAESEKVPCKFLENILAELRQAGIVGSKRGKQGGAYVLRPMEGLMMGELVRLIDGRLAPIGCASETAYEKCTCPDEIHCGLRMLMIDVRNAIARVLDRYSLADVVSVTIRKMERDGISVPFATPKAASPAKQAANPIEPLPSIDPSEGFLHWILGKQGAPEK